MTNRDGDLYCNWCNLRIAPMEKSVRIPEPIDKDFHLKCYTKYLDDRDHGHHDFPVFAIKYVQ